VTQSPTILWLGLTWLGACALTVGLRGYAIKRRLLDVPNTRSSHQVATPRGGGAAIVVAVTLALTGMVPWWLLVGGLLVAGVGFVDDHRHVSVGIRLAGHLAASGLAVIGLGGAPAVGLFGVQLVPSFAMSIVAVVFVAWFINLTNFMDGIDGIAAVQVISVSLIGGGLALLVSPQNAVSGPSAVLAAATAGFLVWNWPPARIFMGDAGSGFVGYMIGVLTVQAASVRPELGAAWLILSGVFVVDASVTLARRAFRRERLHEAHRSHAYQQVAARLRTHRPVTLGVLAINVFWLGPLAWAVAANWISGETGLVLAYGPLILVALLLRAGVSKTHPHPVSR